MEDIAKWIDSLSNLYGNYGVVGLGLVILSLTAVLYIYKYFMNYRKNAKKEKPTKVKHIHPKDSVFFKDILASISYKIPRMQFICSYRSAIFQTLLSAIYSALLEECKTMANKNVKELTNAELRREWEDTIDKASITWHSVCKKKGVFDFVIKEFDKYYSHNEELIKEIIASIIKTERVYESNEEKSMAILGVLSGILNLVLTDAERTCNSMNGRLKNLTFANEKCKGETCKLCVSIIEGKNGEHS
jgi:hypothetical protein